nr:hypothetical protein GCM10020092_057110 [Actinoplanes digitatis]
MLPAMFVNPVRHITFDAHDPFALATFWAVVTGYVVDAESEKGDDEVMIFPPEPVLPGILFIRVPDEKSAKNRVHLDIQPATGTRDETVERLLVA